jgi:hypothetical protein
MCKMNNGKDEACFVAGSRRKLTIGDPTSQITLSKRCDNVAQRNLASRVTDGQFSTRPCDETRFIFAIIHFTHLHGNIPTAPVYGGVNHDHVRTFTQRNHQP